jgi:iron complex outermembrane receptor protein
MSTFASRVGGTSVFVLTTLSLATPTWAASGDSKGDTIEQITITAEKRETIAQETAVSVTAYDAEQLELRGVHDIQDLQFNVPNLIISPNSQSPVTYAYIRGIGSDQLVAGFDPGVAYHLDGVYVGQPSSMPGDLWDMERVEVLRGPQGTLYGRNTTGGSINVITADPTQEFEAFGDVTAGNYNDWRERGVVSGALTDDISARLSFVNEGNDGYQNNKVGPNGDVTNYTSVRAKVKFDFSDTANLVLTAQTFENNGNQSQRRREPFAPAVFVFPPPVGTVTVDIFAGAVPNPSNVREVAKDYPERLNLDNDFLSARLTWDIDTGIFGPATLVATTGYITNDWFQSADIDQSSNPVQFQRWTMNTDQVTQEIRLVSAGKGPWEWIVGAFYFNENLSTDYFFQDSTPVFGFQFSNGGKLKTTSSAVFSQVGYDFREGGHPFKISLGGRYTSDDKHIDEYEIVPAFGLNLARTDRQGWDEGTGKLEFDWFVTDDVFSYLDLSHGYKGGGYSIGQFDKYDPEKVDSVELGVKSQFWSNRAQVNVATFYNDYKDLQVNFLQGISFTTDNAADATIKGVELETLFLPIEQMTFGANLTWLSAQFDKYQFTPTISLDGDTLNRAPKYTVNTFLQYDYSLGDNGTLTARTQYYWQDKVYYRVQNISRHQADAFFTWDARLMWTSANDEWTVDAFCQNITDENNLRNMTVNDGLASGTPTTFDSYFPPRTYGVRVGWKMPK